MSPSLSVVAHNAFQTPAIPAARPDTVAQRVRRLQAEARMLAKDHVHALAAAIAQAEQLASEIAEGGDAYPPGVRDLARRFAEEAEGRIQTLEAIIARA